MFPVYGVEAGWNGRSRKLPTRLLPKNAAPFSRP